MSRQLLCLLGGLLLAMLMPHAKADEIAVLVPTQSSLTQAFISELTRALPGQRVTSVDPGQQLPADTSLVITMGRSTLAYRQQQPATQPTLATYITLETLQADEQLGSNAHTLLANPAPTRQVALAKLLMPGASRLGVLISQQRQAQLPDWQNAATQADRTLNAVVIPTGASLTRSLGEVILDSDILLGTDDSSIYNADNLKTILLTSYSRNKVLIGPSAPFIDAGSLSTTYSSPQDMARSVAYLIEQGMPASAASYPRYFSVLSNAQVARSLGIPLPDDATLARRLAELEQEP
ncbi:MAG: hypothetical protein CMK77_09230 [Pseudomonadales bacterium]|nr:hypothetical protein [Pseudomonadales bacterium]HCB44029.1 hypothetical protein [Pseudomonas sp.]